MFLICVTCHFVTFLDTPPLVISLIKEKKLKEKKSYFVINLIESREKKLTFTCGTLDVYTWEENMHYNTFPAVCCLVKIETKGLQQRIASIHQMHR